MKRQLRITSCFVALGLLAFSARAGEDCGKECTTGAAQKVALKGASAKAECNSKLQTAKLKISGAECADSCDKFAKAVTALKGVKTGAVCPNSHVASISFDPGLLTKKDLVASIQKAGYKVEGEVAEFKVSSLACDSCASKVDKALAKLVGVSAKEVCHTAKHAVVTFDPLKLTADQIVAAIDATGFKVDRETASVQK